MGNNRYLSSALLLLASIPVALTTASAEPNPPHQQPDVPALVDKLANADEVERRFIMEKLDQIKDPDVLLPLVLAALENVAPEDAWKLLDVLARFPGAVKPEPLIRLARRSDPVPSTLGPQLISMGERARAPLLKAIDDTCVTWKPAPPISNSETEGENTDSKKQAAHSRNFLHWAARALADMGSAGRKDLLQMLRGHNACQQSAAEFGLTQYVLSAAPAVDSQVIHGVSDALAASDPAIQKAAVAVVEPMIGFGRATLSPAMIKSLFAILTGNPDVEVRLAAFELLKHARGDVPRRAAEIASRDPDQSIQIAAMDFLENLPRPH